jgi:hypothetical protein
VFSDMLLPKESHLLGVVVVVVVGTDVEPWKSDPREVVLRRKHDSLAPTHLVLLQPDI